MIAEVLEAIAWITACGALLTILVMLVCAAVESLMETDRD